MKAKVQHTTSLHLVWVATMHCLKGTTKVKHWKGVNNMVVYCASIQWNCASFLRVDANTTKLFNFFSYALYVMKNHKYFDILKFYSCTFLAFCFSSGLKYNSFPSRHAWCRSRTSRSVSSLTTSVFTVLEDGIAGW